MSEQRPAAAMCFACGPDNPIGLKIAFACEVRYRQPSYILVVLHGEALKVDDESLVADCTASFMITDQE